MFHEFQPSGRDIFSTAPVPTPPPHKVNGKVNRNVIMHFLAWMFLPDIQKHSHKVRQWFSSDGTRCDGHGFLSSLLCILKDKGEGGIWSCVPVHTYICIDLYLLCPSSTCNYTLPYSWEIMQPFLVENNYTAMCGSEIVRSLSLTCFWLVAWKYGEA